MSTSFLFNFVFDFVFKKCKFRSQNVGESVTPFEFVRIQMIHRPNLERPRCPATKEEACLVGGIVYNDVTVAINSHFPELLLPGLCIRDVTWVKGRVCGGHNI